MQEFERIFREKEAQEQAEKDRLEREFLSRFDFAAGVTAADSPPQSVAEISQSAEPTVAVEQPQIVQLHAEPGQLPSFPLGPLAVQPLAQQQPQSQPQPQTQTLQPAVLPASLFDTLSSQSPPHEQKRSPAQPLVSPQSAAFPTVHVAASPLMFPAAISTSPPAAAGSQRMFVRSILCLNSMFAFVSEHSESEHSQGESPRRGQKCSFQLES